MTASALWQFEQLSPEARSAAEDAARNAGLSLDHWLGRLIAETAAAEGVVLGGPPRGAAAPTMPPRPVPPVQPRAVVQALPVRPVAARVASVPDVVPMTTPPTAQPALSLAPAKAPEPQAQPQATEAVAMLVSPAMLDIGALGTRRDEADVPEMLLAAIARDGVREPIVVRRKSDGRYEIAAGRRRWRAAKHLDLAKIPVMVKPLTDAEAVLASLSENLGAGTLSPIDEARAYLRLLTEFSLDPREVQRAVERDMTHMTRTLRLLGLSPRLRGFVAAGQLSPAQAYALLDTPDPERAANQMLSERSGADQALRRIAAASGEQRS
jgi:ParB/RepB/Spo0J family partition protein